MSGGKWLTCGPRVKAYQNAHAQTEMMEFFHKAALEKQAFDMKVRDAVDALRHRNALQRAQDKRDLDEEYRNYLPPIV